MADEYYQSSLTGAQIEDTLLGARGAASVTRTEAQKTLARANIGAADASVVAEMKEKTDQLTEFPLPVNKGGTGQTTARNALIAFINSLATANGTPTDTDYIITQRTGGNEDGADETLGQQYYRRPLKKLWDWISPKIQSEIVNVNESLLSAFPVGIVADSEAYIKDGVESIPVKSLKIKTDRVQDLSGYDKVWLGGYGDNLIEFPQLSTTVNGITFTTDVRGRLSISGTATSDARPYASNRSTTYAYMDFGPYPAGTYIAGERGFSPQQDSDRITFQVKYADGTYPTGYSSGLRISPTTVGGDPIDRTFTATQPFKVGVWISITAGSTLNLTNVRLIMNTGDTLNDWSPYSNVCSINGFTSASVHVNKKNILKSVRTSNRTIYGVSFTPNSDGSYSISGTATGVAYCGYSYTGFSDAQDARPFRGKRMTLSVRSTSGLVRGTVSMWRADGTADSGQGSSVEVDGVQRVVFTVPDYAYRFRIMFRVDSGVTIEDDTAYIQLEEGASATEYESQTDEVYNVSFSSYGTVYGGTLDVLTGQLTIDRATVTFDGDEDWYIGVSTDNPTRMVFRIDNAISANHASHGDTYQSGDWIGDWANVFPSMSSASNYAGEGWYFRGQGTTSRNFFVITPESRNDMTVEQFKALLANNPLQIVYPLQTPLNRTLTAKEVQTFCGINHIWADTGAVDLEYRADPTLYIQQLIDGTEDDMVANENIASGKYFAVGNNLYLSTAAIASGTSIIPGTNCTKVSIADALNTIASA